MGADKPERAWRTAWLATLTYALFMTMCMGVFWLMASKLICIFDPNPEVVDIGEPLLRVMTYSYPLVAVALILSKAFAGASKTAPPMISAAIAHLVFQIPVAAYWSDIHGPLGAYWAMTAAFALHAAINSILFWWYFAPSRVRAKRSLGLPI